MVVGEWSWDDPVDGVAYMVAVDACLAEPEIEEYLRPRWATGVSRAGLRDAVCAAE
jgi:hypothetical protein